MIISFETQELLDWCSSLEAAEQKLGSAHAQALVSLIADAEAQTSAAELIAFYGDDANVENDDSLSLAIGSNYRARFVVAGVKFGRSGGGEVDWTSVQRLKLVEILTCA